MKILFINPFGTAVYDPLIRRVLEPIMRGDAQITVEHLKDCPADIDYYSSKHLMEERLVEKVIEAEKRGFDSAIIGCCYDPGLFECRELVDIPVIGALESSVHLAAQLGHNFAVITDHHKAVPYIDNLIDIYGVRQRCVSVKAVEVWVKDIIKNPSSVVPKVLALSRRVVSEECAETIVLGCTIVSSCFELGYRYAGKGQLKYTVINPVSVAAKTAEMLVDLSEKSGVRLSRQGLYEKPNYSITDYLRLKEKFMPIKVSRDSK
jgi:allantoin racemase